MIKQMPPNNSVPPPNPPSGNFNANEFDFIMNPGTPQKKSLIPGGPKQRMLIFGVGIAAVVVILLVIIASIIGGGSSATDDLVVIAQKQNEIVRVASIGNTKAASPEAKKLAALAAATTTSDQKAMLDYLAKNKRKVSDKQLVLSQDKDIDNELSSAETNGRFDDVFIKGLAELMIDYQKSVQSSYQTVGSNGKQVLKTSFDNVTLILNDPGLGLAKTTGQTSSDTQLQ